MINPSTSPVAWTQAYIACLQQFQMILLLIEEAGYICQRQKVGRNFLSFYLQRAHEPDLCPLFITVHCFLLNEEIEPVSADTATCKLILQCNDVVHTILTYKQADQSWLLDSQGEEKPVDLKQLEDLRELILALINKLEEGSVVWTKLSYPIINTTE